MIFDSKYSACESKQKIVVSRENGNEHILYNKSGCNIYQYHIDGGIVRDSHGERCDFMVQAELASVVNVYVIELKGSDLNKAISQILKTIDAYKGQLNRCQILPRVIIHKATTHDIHGKKYRDFKKAYPGTVVKVRQYSETV